MNRRRLEAEELRDAILTTSGTLNETLGGPGFVYLMSKTTHSPHYEYYKFDPADPRATAAPCTGSSYVPNPTLS